jgi:hypothetical protein
MKKRIALLVATALALATAALGPPTPAFASTPPPPPTVWPNWYYDFGPTAATHTFTYTNVITHPVVDKPAPFTYPQAFHVTADTCTAPVSPNATCTITVAFTPVTSLGPLYDALALSFTDVTTGKPITTPKVSLFAQRAEYVTSSAYPTGYVMFPNTPHSARHVARGSVHPDYPVIVIVYVWPWWWWKPWPPPPPWDIYGPLTGPWTVQGDTCMNVPTGQTSCQVSVGFNPTSVGTFTAQLNMTFTNEQTGATMPSQTLTLIGTGT